MSNFIKFNYVQQKPETIARVINPNPRMEEIMREINSKPQPQQVVADDGFEDSDFDGFEAGLSAEVVEMEEPEINPEELIQAAQEEANRILSEAQEEANSLLEQAQSQAEQLFEEQKSAGFSKGQQEAQAYLEQQEAALQEQLNVLQQNLEAEYLEKHSVMESEIVDAISQVIEKHFGLMMTNRQETLLYLIRRTIYGIESSKSFKVRVNPENVSVVNEALSDFAPSLGNDITCDVVHDESMNQGDCIIETEYGVYHCGIDLQLNELLAQMRALCQ